MDYKELMKKVYDEYIIPNVAGKSVITDISRRECQDGIFHFLDVVVFSQSDETAVVRAMEQYLTDHLEPGKYKIDFNENDEVNGVHAGWGESDLWYMIFFRDHTNEQTLIEGYGLKKGQFKHPYYHISMEIRHDDLEYILTNLNVE